MKLNQLWWASFGTESKALGVVLLRAPSFTSAILLAAETLAKAVDLETEGGGERIGCTPYPVTEKSLIDLRVSEAELPCYRSPDQLEEMLPDLKEGRSNVGLDVSQLDVIREVDQKLESLRLPVDTRQGVIN